MKLLLIILGHRACWFRQERGLWCTPIEEPLGVPDANGRSTSQCPWLDGQPVQVELVLDTEFHEVELRTLAHDVSLLASWLDYRGVRRRVLQDQPAAGVSLVRLPSGRRAISVVQRLPQAEAQAWLAGLDGVTFTTVRSLGDLLAARSSLALERARKDCLYVLFESGACRHLLYLSGRLCFARLVPAADESTALPAVQDTIDHLQAIGVATQGLMLHTLGLSVDAQQRLAAASHCAGQTMLDSPLEPVSDHSLASWLAALANPRGALLPGMTTGIGRLLRSIDAGLPGAIDGGSEPVSVRSRQRLPDVPFDSLLQRWQALWQAVRRLGMSAVASLLLLATLWSTGADALARWQGNVDELDALARLQQQINRLRDQAHQLHASPIRAERSLLRRQAFARSAAWQPRLWLSALAGALTAHESIVLDTLEWSRQSALAPDPELAGRGSGAPGTASDQLIIFDRTGHRRQALPDSSVPGDRLVVGLEGHIDATLPLREQQDLLAGFRQTLESLHGVATVRMEHSPINDFSASHTRPSGASEQPRARQARFRLRLQLIDKAQPPPTRSTRPSS